MHLLNHYFIPFAAFLILSAVVIVEPERRTTWLSLGVLAVALAVNWWFANRAYRHIRWTRFLRQVQVWLNYLWAIPLFLLLGGYWGPMWLLFVLAPVTAALFMSWWRTLVVALVSAGTMCAILALRGVEGTSFWGMTVVHAGFIVFISLFVNALSQVAVKLRGG